MDGQHRLLWSQRTEPSNNLPDLFLNGEVSTRSHPQMTERRPKYPKSKDSLSGSTEGPPSRGCGSDSLFNLNPTTSLPPLTRSVSFVRHVSGCPLLVISNPLEVRRLVSDPAPTDPLPSPLITLFVVLGLLF